MRFAGLLALLFLLASYERANAATLRILTLPSNATIDLYSEQRAVSVNARGDVVVNVVTDRGSRIVAWDRIGNRRLLDPPIENVPGEPRVDVKRAETAWGVMATDGRVFGVETYPFEGAYIGTVVRPYIWDRAKKQIFQRARCGGVGGFLFPTANSSDDRIAMSTRSVDPVSSRTFDDATPPAAFIIQGERCDALEIGWINSIAGVYASGYRTYEGSTIVSVHPNANHAFTFRAVRWNGKRALELGAGISFGVNAHGDCVGASRLLEIGAALPVRAIVWHGSRATTLATKSRNSVAYAINETGRTIVGSVWDDRARHAVRWRNGREERLESFLHAQDPPQLEVAYGITPDGWIYGIGRRHGSTVIFFLSVSR